MAYVKHPIHGNKHVVDHEVPALVAQGWVKWPRTDKEKALGDGSDAAYWRKKYERDVLAAGKASESDAEADDSENQDAEPVKRRGRPAKV